MRPALAVCIWLLSALTWAGPASDSALRPAPDWTLSDEDLFEVVAAETSTSTVGHERSVHAGPADHSDADDPGPESLPGPERGATAISEPGAGRRVGLRPAARSAAPGRLASVPLRL